MKSPKGQFSERINRAYPRSTQGDRRIADHLLRTYPTGLLENASAIAQLDEAAEKGFNQSYQACYPGTPTVTPTGSVVAPPPTTGTEVTTEPPPATTEPPPDPPTETPTSPSPSP